jgi:alanine dehydrogenase
LGWQEACRRDEALRLGLNVVHGEVVYKGVADAWDLPLVDVASVLEGAAV